MTLPAPDPHPAPRELGLRLIVGYKLFKAAAQLVLGVVLLVGKPDLFADLHALVTRLGAHATAAWSLGLTHWLGGVTTGHSLRTLGAAALLDSVLSFVEGWALHRRYAWSRWLIVVATASLVPFEIDAIVRRHSPARILLLALNVVIVAYLVRARVAARGAARR